MTGSPVDSVADKAPPSPFKQNYEDFNFEYAQPISMRDIDTEKLDNLLGVTFGAGNYSTHVSIARATRGEPQ
jgi:hypothetical protein